MPGKYVQCEQFYRLGDYCHYCKEPFGRNQQRAKTRDHRIPKSRGGADSGVNIVACCHQCNITKSNMTEDEFLEWVRRGRPNKVAYMKEIGLIPQKGDEAICRPSSSLPQRRE